MHAFKRLKIKTISVVAAIAVAAAVLFGAFVFARPVAHADTEDITEFVPTSLGLSNTQFDSSSGSYPASPSSWTATSSDDAKSSVVAGVVDLTASTYFGSNSGNKKFKLDQYPEYADNSMPQTIFGTGSAYANSDAKTLLINTAPNAEAVYSYKSGDMTFAPNSFYRVSAWVKTSNFAPDSGATIKLTGLGQNCSFLNINTVKNLAFENGIPKLDKNNDYGWLKYTFYVRTSAALTKTVNLVLGIGDTVNGNDEDPDIMPRPAHGYAFFDTVAAERISAHDFATETVYFAQSDKENVYKNTVGTSLAIDLNETESFAVNDIEIGSFSDNDEQWQRNIYYDENSDDLSYAGAAYCALYNSESIIPDLSAPTNVHGLTQNPWSPYGRAEYVGINNPMFTGTNANIMLISTYDGKEFKNAAYGIASPSVTIKRFKYYRFSVWVKTDSVEGGSGATIMLKGKSSKAQKTTKLTEYTGLTGDNADDAHYGWKEQIVYIQGSMLADYSVRFELWLGAPEEMSKGIAMFDNATFTELTYKQFKDMSGADGGNVYALDADNSETGIANGNFSAVGDVEETDKFPMPVADWKYLTPDTVETRGFSKEKVNVDKAVYGLLPTDEEMFNSIAGSGAIPGVTNPANMYSPLYTVMLLSSTQPTAFCYQSPSITLSTDKANKLTVEMAVDGVTSGYGASLVLKTTEGDVLSTIENIKSTNRTFRTFTFYLDAPLADQTVYVEIWLGLNDRSNNTQKLSNGNIYVRKAALTEWTAPDESKTVKQEFAEVVAKYKADVTSPAKLANLDYGVYSFTSPSFDYYDVYSYVNGNGELGTLYRWSKKAENQSSSISGMFNADTGYKPYDGFDKKDLSGNMLYIFNTDKNLTTYKFDNSLTLVSNMYYRIDVPVKVRVSDEVRKDKTSVGANIKLTGANAAFENIKDTTTLLSKNNEESRDYETFKTYTFYVATGENGGSIGLEISFGGADKASYIQGKLVVGNITMTEIDNVEYEKAEKDKKNKYATAVKLSDTSDSDDDKNNEAVSSEIQWWIIPTVIFSAALIAVVGIIIFVRVRDRIKRKKKIVYTSEYDRNDVMKDIERLKAQQDSDLTENDDATYDPEEYDDVNDADSAQDASERSDTAEPAEQNEDTSKVSDSLDD